MAEALGGEGQVGIVYLADFFVTRQRYDAFKATIEENYPNIEIFEEQGIAGPDFAGQADQVASAMLTRNADLTASGPSGTFQRRASSTPFARQAGRTTWS